MHETVKSKSILVKKGFGLFSILMAMLFIYGCPNSKTDLPNLTGVNATTGIPYSTTDTIEVLQGGQVQYDSSMKRWRDRVASSPNMSREPYTSGPCVRPNAGFPEARLATEFMTKSKSYRESLGGPGCRCIPMGDLCLPNICNCSEICPNDHGIFQQQASQMEPNEANRFKFLNSNDPVAFSTHPNTRGGFCAGMQLQRRKFASLARFKPNLISRPAMSVPGPAYVTYIKQQIDRLVAGEGPNFLGAVDLTDLRRKDPEIERYFRLRTGAAAVGEYEPNAKIDPLLVMSGEPLPPPGPHVDGQVYTPPNGLGGAKLHFAERTSTNITAVNAVDTDIDLATGQPYGPIPVQGTAQFETYMAKKVERVAQGYPAILPGYGDIYTVSKHPTYEEIIGRYSAIDWQQVNAMDNFFTGPESPASPVFTADNMEVNSRQPMVTSEMDALLDKLANRVPTYPGTGSGRWNENGPWQSASLEFMGSNNPAAAPGTDDGQFYHSVEAYAVSPQSNGDTRICIGDPNVNRALTGACGTYMTIPKKKSDGTRDPMVYNDSEFAPRVLGKVGIQGSSDRYQGMMTSRMVEYCRTINRGKFNAADCGG